MCRTGCKTKDHQSWGECARAAMLQIDPLGAGPVKRENANRLNRYAALRKAGVQPKTTAWDDVRRAEHDGGIPKAVQAWSGGGAWPSQA